MVVWGIHINIIACLKYNVTMKYLIRLLGVLLIVSCLQAAGSGSGVDAQRGQTWQYFPDTGHSISGEFWFYYQNNDQAAFVFGSPITEQFLDPKNGRLVQYFQRARFELYPERPDGQKVALTDLGPEIYANSPQDGAGVNNNNPLSCRPSPKTGYPMCFAFLEFYDANGGAAVFGEPITAFKFYNDRIVQYFERARFDWYPEKPEGQKVSLAQVGRIYFDMAREDPTRLQPVRVDNTISNIKSIQARVFTWKTLIKNQDEQAIYVIVQDQTLNPVAGATTVVTIRWSNGEVETIARTSNAAGVVILPILVKNQAHGSLILVRAEVLFQGLQTASTGSFRIWD
jgi:hypothetical protein